MKNIGIFVKICCLFVVFGCQSLTAMADTETTASDTFFYNLVADKYVNPFREGDVDTWLQAFHEDALALHNGRPLDRGIDSIEQFGRLIHENFVLGTYEVDVTDIRRSDQWVYTVGRYKTDFINKSDGKSPWGVSEGKFVLLWERQADGEWKIILDMGNSNSR